MSTEHQTPSKTNPSSDELDLRDFFTGLVNILAQMWKVFIRGLIQIKRSTARHMGVLIMFLILGLGGAIGYHFLLNPELYLGTMIIRSDFLNGPLLENYIEKLNGGPQNISEILKIEPEKANEIVKFETEPFITEEEIIEFELLKKDLEGVISQPDVESIIEKLTLKNRSTYKIHVYTLAPTALENLQEPLWNWITEIPYIKKRMENERRVWQARKDKANRESLKLDSLKSVLFANLKKRIEETDAGSNNVILGERGYTDPIQVFREDLALFYQKESAKEQLFLEPRLEVIDGLTSYGKTSFSEISLLVLILYLSLVGLLGGYFVVFLIEFNKYLVIQEANSKLASDASD